MSATSFSPIATKIQRLKQIAAGLPAYTNSLAATPNVWLTPEYIQTQLATPEEFLARHTTRDTAIDALQQQVTQTGTELAKVATGAVYYAHACQIWHAAELAEALPVSFGRDLTEKTRLLIDFFATAKTKTTLESSFGQFDQLKTSLESSLAAYLEAKNTLLAKQNESVSEKSELAVQIDAIDDLYYHVKNALEGTFHEDHAALVALMPWRKPKSTPGVAQHPVSVLTNS